MIGILTDSIIANIPLMKIAAHFKLKESVSWYMPLLHNKYSKIYYSKIFNYTSKIDREEEMDVGGTGYSLIKKLPSSIDRLDPDYSIYPEIDYSLQYYSRGCPRKCKFCVVPNKEGGIHKVKPMKLNRNGKYIKVLDNNFFANKQWKESMSHLIKCMQPVSFDSGIDIRLFNDDQGEALKKIRIHKYLYIAWDNPAEDLTNKIELLKKYIRPYKITVYVLIGFNSTAEEDYYRVMKIKELKCNPFVMPYDKYNEYQKNFSRWVNRKPIFKSVPWKEYKNK